MPRVHVLQLGMCTLIPGVGCEVHCLCRLQRRPSHQMKVSFRYAVTVPSACGMPISGLRHTTKSTYASLSCWKADITWKTARPEGEVICTLDTQSTALAALRHARKGTLGHCRAAATSSGHRSHCLHDWLMSAY